MKPIFSFVKLIKWLGLSQFAFNSLVIFWRCSSLASRSMT